MPKFRKKPVEIEAIRLPCAYLDSKPVQQSVRRQLFELGANTINWVFTRRGLTIPTLEGDHLASPGDWVIRGVAGEFYPCKPEIFAETYEPVSTD